MTIPVALAFIPDYAAPGLDRSVARVLEAAEISVTPGTRVLVKPNLVHATNAANCTTHPEVVRAACVWLLDHGATVSVADSPGYGPAHRVARASGLEAALRPLGIKINTLGDPVRLSLSDGTGIGVSRHALEADMLLNMPKLKAHGQMVMSGAVKNLFGCVVGCRKALAHSRMGHDPQRFRAIILDVCLALPQAVHLMDGIRVLHKDGPVRGEAFPLGLLGAARNGVALDTAAYSIFGLGPDAMPLWAEASDRQLEGSAPHVIRYPLEAPTSFNTTGFEYAAPKELSFAPLRLLRGRMKSLLAFIKRPG
ncbi:DUF362 domain-containing protein [Pseudodesulfovibrio sp.]|uniref:DUF362 domain-containing protein n=1 Tax=unclassified Pseudodesulfovibrio TaxID=2661612 RepID=UPI003B003775